MDNFKMSKDEKTPFEDALNLTGFGKFNILTFMLCGTIAMSMATEMLSVGYLVPASACELHTTSTQQGLMAAVPLFGIITMSHFWGYMADTRGRKKVLSICMICGSLSSVLGAFSPDWITFSVFKFLSTGSVSGALALSLTLISECTLAAKRSILIMLSSSVFLCTNGLMAVVAIPVLPLKFSYYVPFLDIQICSWRALSLVFSSPCVLSAFGLFLSYESPKYLLSVGKDEQALEIMRAIFVINNKKSAAEYPVKAMSLDELSAAHSGKGFFSSIWNQTVPLFKPPLLKTTWYMSTIFIVVLICIQPYLVWLPYMTDGFMRSIQNGEDGLTFCQRLRSSQNASEIKAVDDCSLNTFALTMVSSVGVLLAIINTILSSMLNFIGRKRLILIIQFLSGFGGMCIAFTPVWQLSGIFIIVYMGGILNFGLLTSFSVDLFPTQLKAMAVSLTMMIGRASAVIGINVLKILLDTNCEAAFYIFASITLFGGFLCFLLPRNAKPPSKSCPETYVNNILTARNRLVPDC